MKNALARRVIKLYSVSPMPSDKLLNRPMLVDTLLALFQKCFGELPKHFDIHGPYGVKKGSTVGIKSFRNKLEKRGHGDYYALTGYADGYSEGPFGFDCLFDAMTNSCHTYNEIVIWYLPDKYEVNVNECVSALIEVFPIDYGYVVDLPYNYDVNTEAKNTNSFWSIIFGFKSIHNKLGWCGNIASVLEGKIPDLFSVNFLNDKQADELKSIGLQSQQILKNGIRVLSIPDLTQLKSSRMIYRNHIEAEQKDSSNPSSPGR